MRTIYHAAHAIEAHILVDVLRQQGITAHVRGEFLQGGIGELPAGGLVRIEVDDDDLPRARQMIDDWLAAPVPDDPPEPDAAS
jgi:hypothetical protein